MISLSESVSAFLDSGGLLLVPTRQRAAAVRRAVAAARCGAAGVWTTPKVLAPRAWLMQLAVERGLPRVLSPQEEWVLWRQGVESLASGATRSSCEVLADAMQRAAALVADYRIAENAIARVDTDEAQWLSQAMESVRRAAGERDALASFDLAARLADLGPIGELRPRLLGVLVTPALHALGLRSSDAIDMPSGDSVRCVPRSHSALDAADEHASIAAWARARLQQNPQARLLVLLPDLDSRRSALDRVLCETLTPSSLGGEAVAPVHEFEGGAALAEADEIVAALETLQAITRPVSRAHLARVLEAGYWSGARDARARIAQHLRLGHADHVPPFKVADIWRAAAMQTKDLSAAEECIGRFELARLAIQNEAHPSLRIAHALAALEWDRNGGADSVARQTRAAFGALIATLPQQRDADARETVNLLGALSRREHFAPSIGDVAVTVSAARDHPVVGYDGIWFAGLQADRWPEPTRLDPFIPWELQRAAGMPNAQAAGRLAHARGLLDTLPAYTNELVYSWARVDGDAELSPSVLLRDRVDLGDRDAPPRVIEPATSVAEVLRLHMGAVRETFVDDVGLAWNVGRAVPGGSYALAQQAQCAFRAYAYSRLARTPGESWEPGVSSRERGRWLHAVLEAFWRSVGSSAILKQMSGEQIDAALARALESVPVDEVVENDLLEARVRQRERDRCRRAVIASLKIECTRPDFVVEAIEQERSLSVAGLNLRLRPDRIDRFDDGRRFVLDYKTGTHKSLDFEGERPTAMQLFAYAYALEAEGLEVAGLGNLSLELRGAKISSASADAAGDWASFRDHYRAAVQRFAQAFGQGDARVDPLDGACKFCELTPLCRRTELGVDRSSDDAVNDDEGGELE